MPGSGASHVTLEDNEAALRRIANEKAKELVEEPLKKMLTRLQRDMAGRPVDEVQAELKRRLRRDVPALQNADRKWLRSIAEKISAAK